jgi:hypothetical protein
LFFFIFIFLISRYFGVVFCIHCVWLPRWMIDITTEREVAEFVFLFFSLLNIFSQGIKSEKKKKKLTLKFFRFPPKEPKDFSSFYFKDCRLKMLLLALLLLLLFL